MPGYLIAEEGPLTGLELRFEEGTEWVLGRDPDIAGIVLEDPMVSRKHVVIRLTSEGLILENLSAVNPATQNGKVITEPVLLREGDILQIGSTFFRFSEEPPFVREEEEAPFFEEEEDLSSIHFAPGEEGRWVVKVIAGPNSGAEFNLQPTSTYILGKDPNLCDIVFQDLSVSRQHARLSVDEKEQVFIEDLGSRNGVLVNGELIHDKRQITSQDLIALGTTTFLLIDRKEVQETIISPPIYKPELPEAKEVEAVPMAPVEEPVPARDWKEMLIPKKHIFLAGTFALLVLLAVVAMFSLFKTQTVVVEEKDETQEIQKAIAQFSDIQFTFNSASGKLFLVGHVLTNVEKQELLYILKGFSYITTVDDNVVVDEYVWQNINALLMTNPAWQGVAIYAPTPGHFVVRGYLQTLEELQTLVDYLNMNFPYLDRLENQVVVENNLATQIQSLLIEKGYSAVTFQLSNGELVLAGRVDSQQTSSFKEIVDIFKALPGIRMVKNFVIYTTADTSRIDLSSQYNITGYSKRDDTNYSVVINGRILSAGDTLDGMHITAVEPNIVLLEKDGLKFKINYNLQ